MIGQLEKAGVEFSGAPSSGFNPLWIWLFALLLFLPLLLLMLRGGLGQAGSRSPFGFGRSFGVTL